MRVVDNHGYIASNVALMKLSGEAPDAAGRPKLNLSIVSAGPGGAEKISLSGEALLQLRLFDKQGSAAIEVGGQTTTREVAEFSALTEEDRKLLSNVYNYAQEQHASLEYVDDLARRLASYRKDKDGTLSSPLNVQNAKGQRVNYHFTANDALIASRIRHSDALGNTQLDKGFVLRMTDEAYSALEHSHFGFLEKVVTRFSNKGERLSTLGAAFKQMPGTPNNYIRKVTNEAALPGAKEDKSVEGSRFEVKKPAGSGWSGKGPIPMDILNRMISGLGSVARAVPTLFEFMSRSGR